MDSFDNFYMGNYFSPIIYRTPLSSRLFISDEKPNLGNFNEEERKEYLRECGKFIRDRILEYLSLTPNPLHKSTLDICLELDKEEQDGENN